MQDVSDTVEKCPTGGGGDDRPTMTSSTGSSGGRHDGFPRRRRCSPGGTGRHSIGRRMVAGYEGHSEGPTMCCHERPSENKKGHVK